MSLLNYFFKKKVSILTEEDNIELRNLRRKAYMEEAKKLVEERAKEQARQELGIKPKKDSIY